MLYKEKRAAKAVLSPEGTPEHCGADPREVQGSLLPRLAEASDSLMGAVMPPEAS